MSEKICNNKGDIIVHNVEWDKEKISKFWDLQSEAEDGDGYFSAYASKSLIRLLKKNTSLTQKNILDYGCGTGCFLAMLSENVKSDTMLYGCDVSKESVEVTNSNKKLNESLSWHGAYMVLEDNYLPFEDSSMDIITCLEVIEHIDDITLKRLFDEMFRVLKPNGILMISTPNNENLKRLTVVCPDCGCRFHRYQHMRKWTGDSISRMLKEDFEVYKIYQRKINPSLFHEIKSEIYYWVSGKRYGAPNLIWFGKKK